MSYVVLARRYRPQKFSDIVGQEHVALTLRNAIKNSRSSHAYLFTGPRGTGKTSTARILAKALRCQSLSSEGEPCNTCFCCKSMNEGTSLDVIEIDAASNTGVDNIRELRETVAFAASEGKYRIYIIDEVHMLSTAAFNALLKTLEEPPPHVVFIFATTELHKVLPTIQSRCQRFDFKKIAAPVMKKSLREICVTEKVEIDEASLATLTLESEGCLRDAQSLLDQAIVFCGNKITIQQLEEALGLTSRTTLMNLLRAVGNHNPGEALKISSEALHKGADAKIILARFLVLLRNLHYRAFTGESEIEDGELDSFMDEIIKKLSRDEIVRAMELTLRTQASLYTNSNTAMALEALLVKLCLQRPAVNLPQVELSNPTSRPVTQSVAAPTLPPTPNPHSSAPTSSIGPIEDYIRRQKPAWTPVLQSILHVELKDDSLNVRAKTDFAGKRLASNDGIELLKIAYKVKKVSVTLEALSSSRSGGPEETKSETLSPQEKIKLAREHEAVRTALETFKGTITETQVLQGEKI